MASKFGVREICDVVLKAKAMTKIGNKIFYAGEPVMYFDTLKTSSMEGAATTVYAQGGRGNTRLVAWEGERTVTFTMEDALISPEGFMILSGAGLIDAEEKPIYQHTTETIDAADIINLPEDAGTAPRVVVNASGEGNIVEVILSKPPYLDETRNVNLAYVMFMKDGDVVTEPYIPNHGTNGIEIITDKNDKDWYKIKVEKSHPNYSGLGNDDDKDDTYTVADIPGAGTFDSILVDFYVEHTSNAQQIEITADKFGGNYYLEAATLFRDQNGNDMPAEFIIPNCKIQSNFTFTMASSGDPSSFTFTMDAFPDYTKFDHSKKVLAAIQIIKEAGAVDKTRVQTKHLKADEDFFI